MKLRSEDYRYHVDALFAAALAAAEPGNAVRELMRCSNDLLHVGEVDFDTQKGRVFIVSVGKAAAAMADAAVDIVDGALHSADVVGKKGGAVTTNSALERNPRVRLLVGNHPVSGEDSVQSTAAVVEQLSETTENDLVIFLISGGASALLTQPSVSLADWKLLTSALLASGCTINELNTVRRQLDGVKGGGLARLAAPAKCVSLVLSDVVGNPLEVIGSGPTVLISRSADDALTILEQYDIAQVIGDAAYERIKNGLRRRLGEDTLEPSLNEHYIVGDVRKAAEAAATRAEELGFESQVLAVHLEGEAREVGRVAAAIAKNTSPGKCLILGGETTVTLRGDGLGGRNLETALAAAISLSDWSEVAFASLATDGEDGQTPAAGAAIAGWTAPYAVSLGVFPEDFLNRNDSFSFFQKLDEANARAKESGDRSYPPCLVVTGSSGTNVNDLLLILSYEQGYLRHQAWNRISETEVY